MKFENGDYSSTKYHGLYFFKTRGSQERLKYGLLGHGHQCKSASRKCDSPVFATF